jgi:hypothetical protein
MTWEILVWQTKQNKLPCFIYIYIIITKNGSNLSRNSTSQMVFYLLVKMINQIVSYFIGKNDHPSHNSHNNESKSTYQIDKVFFMLFILGIFLIKNFNQKTYFFSIGNK